MQGDSVDIYKMHKLSYLRPNLRPICDWRWGGNAPKYAPLKHLNQRLFNSFDLQRQIF